MLELVQKDPDNYILHRKMKTFFVGTWCHCEDCY